MNTIDTINTIFFPLFLFGALYCFSCCLVYLPNAQAREKEPEEFKPIEQGVKEFLWSDHQPEVEGADTELAIPSPELEQPFSPPEEIIVTPSATVQNDHVLEVIGKLSKRQARPLCKPLGIKQKVSGGKELSLTFTRAQIKRRFKENPNLVIATIEEKLPNLFKPHTDAEERIAS